MENICFYHRFCNDGIGSLAILMRVKDPDSVQYEGVQYGEDFSKYHDWCKDKDVYILDFSFPIKDLRAILNVAKSVTMIDHHPYKDEYSVGLRALKEEFPEPKFTVVYTLGISGAMLTWNYFFPYDPVPLIVQHLNDRDLWRKEQCANWDDVIATFLILESKPFQQRIEFLTLAIGGDSVIRSALQAEGASLLKFYKQTLWSLITQSITVVKLPWFKGAIDYGNEVTFEVAVINCPHILMSDALDMVISDFPVKNSQMAMGYYIMPNGQFKFSARGIGVTNYPITGIDSVITPRDIAQRFGGGGHITAAGFQVDPRVFFNAEGTKFLEDGLSFALNPIAVGSQQRVQEDSVLNRIGVDRLVRGLNDAAQQVWQVFSLESLIGKTKFNYYRSGWVTLNQTHIDTLYSGFRQNSKNADQCKVYMVMPEYLATPWPLLDLDLKGAELVVCNDERLDGVAIFAIDFKAEKVEYHVAFHVDRAATLSGIKLDSITIDPVEE